MKKLSFSLLVVACVAVLTLSFLSFRSRQETAQIRFVGADDKNIQYMGRVDFSNPKLPRFWAPGVTVKAKFKGTFCDVILNDEVLWNKSHNYLEVAIDDQAPVRLQTTAKTNTIRVAEGLPRGLHTVTICKNTEAGIGYLEFVGLRCEGVVKLPAKPKHKIEFIGDSITCGTGSDESKVACEKAEWYDQHNAYMSYGPRTARALDAQWQLTSVSGIGLMHSCCDMKLTMPDVFDKVNLRENALPWDFGRYQPDAVSVCLGQNDGAQDETAFVANYVKFIRQIRAHYPKAHIVCITSPMADSNLRGVLQGYLAKVVETANEGGDKNVSKFFFSRSWNSGCGGHPNMAEHEIIAAELSAYLKTALGW